MTEDNASSVWFSSDTCFGGQPPCHQEEGQRPQALAPPEPQLTARTKLAALWWVSKCPAPEKLPLWNHEKQRTAESARFCPKGRFLSKINECYFKPPSLELACNTDGKRIHLILLHSCFLTTRFPKTNANAREGDFHIGWHSLTRLEHS